MNPFNPLNWIKSTQGWFSSTEKSSGFRPYLIALIVLLSFSLALLLCFRDDSLVKENVFFLCRFFVIAFIIVFVIKAFQDPQFCRSEKHVERVMKMEMDKMGSESHQVDADVIERKLLGENGPEK